MPLGTARPIDMSLLDFDKSRLGNLEYSLQREMLSTNRSGGYMSSTIVYCNTRKYHGLMVCPIDEVDEKTYVLLSSLDETIIYQEQAFNLAIHRYPGLYEPRGHRYIVDFKYTPTPTVTYRVGDVVLQKELLWIHSRTQLMIRYSLLEAPSKIELRLRPFMAYRDKHALAQANAQANGRASDIDSGVQCRMYSDFPTLNMQMSKKSKFVSGPEWYLNFEYLEEAQRGYPYREDLLTPGYFEVEMKCGESVIFSCSLEEVNSGEIKKTYEEEIEKRSDKRDFLSCLRHSARQFIIRQGGRTEVVAGYPWFGRWGRDTFIALPGITLTQGGVESCMEVLDTMVGEMQDGLFPNMGTAYNSVDAPLWFFWTLQQLEKEIGSSEVWKRYGKSMKQVLESYRSGGEFTAVHDNGLVWASNPTHAMTWMDAVVHGKPVTGRDGYQVEINALWYNAVCYALEMARQHNDGEFIDEWEHMPEQIKESFLLKFWYNGEGYLADYVDEKGQNIDIRPNQVIACSMKYSMLSDNQVLSVMSIVRQHLLTPKGLRTLSPRHPDYKGRIEGDQPTRDLAYHQGTVWPWLLEHYVAGGFGVYGKEFLPEAEEILEGFTDLSSYGIGSIAEIFDGDPPHAPRGAPSQAWSVAAILRIEQMIQGAK